VFDEISDPCELCIMEFGDAAGQLCNGCAGSSGASTAMIGAILAADVAAAASPTGEQQDQPLVSDDTIARPRLSSSDAIFPYLSRPP
jgi:flavin-dependent dehydrogenase